MDATQLLDRFHRQVRLTGRDFDPDLITESDGPVRRSYPADPATPGAMIESPAGLGTDPQHWIERQRRFFGDRGQRVEWKTYGYDKPADLSARLAGAGFEPAENEVLLLGEATVLAQPVPVPPGVTLRTVTPDAAGDELWMRARQLLDLIWGTEQSWVNDQLQAEQRRFPALAHPVVAQRDDDGAVVSFAMLRITPDTEFAGMWGGSTHPDWRGRGLYRAGLAYRAQLAQALGVPFVRVDTSPDSRPILIRLGLLAVTTTTPHLLDPGPAPAAPRDEK